MKHLPECEPSPYVFPDGSTENLCQCRILKPLWVIQENLNRDDEELLPVLRKLDIPYQLIKIIPFSDSIPDIDYVGPIIVRGSTTTLKGTEKKSWKPGVWHNSDFKPSVYAHHYQELFLNNDGLVSTIGNAENLSDWSTRKLRFVRPNSDYKDLTGRVMTKRDLVKLSKGVALGQYPFDSSLELFIASPKTILNESRFTVVDGKIISGYTYRVDQRLKRMPSPERFFKTAQEAVERWKGPADVYSLDIGETKTGRLGVVECNCFNASGIYGDAETIVKAVTQFVCNSLEFLS